MRLVTVNKSSYLRSENLLEYSFVLGVELRLGNGRDCRLAEFDLESLGQLLLGWAKGHLIETLQSFRKFSGLSLDIVRVLASDGNYPSNAFGDAAFLKNDELFNL